MPRKTSRNAPLRLLVHDLRAEVEWRTAAGLREVLLVEGAGDAKVAQQQVAALKTPRVHAKTLENQ